MTLLEVKGLANSLEWFDLEPDEQEFVDEVDKLTDESQCTYEIFARVFDLCRAEYR